MVLTKPYKIFLSLNGKTSQKATKAALAVCSMIIITFLQEVISGYNGCKITLTLSMQPPNTTENRNFIRYSLRIFTRIFLA